MKESPLISIIVPVYNVEKYLSHCIDSLLHQTYKNLEIICVNDGSPDCSAEILEVYSKKDTRMKVVTQKNLGVSAARNAGLELAQGDYIMFVDGDDWIDAETCQTALDAANTYNADLVFWSYTREFGNASREKLLQLEDETCLLGEDAKRFLHRRQIGLVGEELRYPEYADALVTVWGKLYSKSLLKQSEAKFIDIHEVGTSEDALFNLQVLSQIKIAVYIKCCFYHYRKNNDASVTTKYKSELYQQWSHLFDVMSGYIDHHKLSSDYSQALQNRISLSIVGLGLNTLAAPCSGLKKIKMVKEILSAPRYRQAIGTLELRYFPVHWKVFYLLARWNCSVGVYLMLQAIRKIISRG